jgi:hypothetical protein
MGGGTGAEVPARGNVEVLAELVAERPPTIAGPRPFFSVQLVSGHSVSSITATVTGWLSV